MKKQLLKNLRLRAVMLVALLCAGISGAWGETVTWSGQDALPKEFAQIGGDSPIIIMVSQENGYTNPIRVYANTTITIQAALGYVIQSVTYEASSTGDYVTNAQYATVSPQVTPTVSSKYVTWSYGNNSEVTNFTFTPGAQTRCNSISVTYKSTGGSSTQTCATPTFSVESGVYTSTKTVTLASADGATIYYTTDGNNPTTSSSEYKSAITVSETMTIKAIAVKEGYNNSQVASATYAILQHAGTEADPYTIAATNVCVKGKVSEVSNFYETNGQLTYKLYDNTITDGNEFQVFKGKGLNGANFTSKGDLKWNDEVIVKGEIDKWSTTYEFKENSQLVSLVEYLEPIINVSAREITLKYNETEGSIEYSITNPKEDYELSAWASSEDTWIKNITVTTDKITFECDVNDTEATRTTTITLSYFEATTISVTVTQEHDGAGRANLPFEFNGGKADIEATEGLTQEGLGTDYSSSPKLKFDDADDKPDNLILHFNGRPGTLSFDIKGNGSGSTSWAGTFKVQTSENGEDYTDLATYTDLTSTKQSKEIKDLPENAHYIKWIYTEKSVGNVALGNTNLTEYVPPKPYTLTIAEPEHVTGLGIWSNGTMIGIGNSGTILEGDAVVVSALSFEEGYELERLTVTGEEEGQEVEVTFENDYWRFTMPPFNATLNAVAVKSPVRATYTLATSILPGKRYVIANGTEDGAVKVMAGQTNNNRAGEDATITDGVLTTLEEYEFVIEGDEMNGYTIYDEQYGEDKSGYLYAASSSNNYLRTQEVNNKNGVWKITFDATSAAASIVAQGSNSRNTMRYNSSDKLFSCYAPTSTTQKPVYLFKKVENELKQTATFTISKSCYDVVGENKTYYGTFSCRSVFFAPEDLTVAAVTVSNGILTVTPYDTGGLLALPNSAGVLVSSSTYGAKTIDIPSKIAGVQNIDNMLRPSGPNGITAEEMAEANPDCIFYRLTMHDAGSGNPGTIGFWWGADKGGPFSLGANKAYLAVPSDQAGGIKGFSFSDMVDGIKAVETAETEETESNAIYNLAGQRVSKMQKGIYIVNGKKVLVK